MSEKLVDQKFRNRSQAAYLLSEELESFHVKQPLVLGIPRGAVPMARIIAENLGGELDVILVHKFTSPKHPEFAIGSVTEEGSVFLSEGADNVSEKEIDALAKKEIEHLRNKRKLFTPLKSPLSPSRREVVIVDDGIATGATMIAAIRSLQSKGASRIIVAAPVSSQSAHDKILAEGAEVCVLRTPEHFISVSQFFDDFSEVTDSDVADELAHDPRLEIARLNQDDEEDIRIRLSNVVLDGTLSVPRAAHGLVLFAHGSGSSRKSPRNLSVAKELNQAGLGTLLFDLLLPNESDKNFDLSLLSERLEGVIRWAAQDLRLKHLTIGLFGASTGAAAAMVAAADLPQIVASVVARGGRPDLALNKLLLVKAPTLLIVGSEDHEVLELNKSAMMSLKGNRVLSIVAGAHHLFEEPGALDQVADLAKDWFNRHLHGPKKKARLIRPAAKKPTPRRGIREPEV